MKPSEVYVSALEFYRKGLRCIGCDIYDENYRKTSLTWFVVFCIAAYVISIFISIIQLFEENPKFFLEALATSNAGITGAVKLYCYLKAAKDIFRTHQFIIGVYQKYETINEMYYKAVNENSQLFVKVVKVISSTYFIPMTLYCLTPLIYYGFTNERHLLEQFLIPYVDVETTQGYFLTVAIQVLLAILCVVGLCCTDVILVGFLLQSLLLCEIFKCKVHDFNQSLAVIEVTSKTKNIHVLRDEFEDLIEWHQMSLSFIKTISEIFSVVVSTVILSSSFSIVLTLYVLLTNKWPGGYSFLIVCFYSIYVYCFFGTRIQICNEKFAYEIYQIHWYKLPIPQQKMIHFMLMRSHRSQEILISNFLPLTVGTGFLLTRKIYSVFTMMLRLVTRT